MHGKPISTSFTAAILALTCALALGAVVFSQSRAFRDSFERANAMVAPHGVIKFDIM